MKKLVAAIVLLVIAGTVAFFLKDFIDSENPDYAIALIEVSADKQILSHVLAGYEWSFYNGRSAARPTRMWSDLDMPSNELLGGEALNITFTLPAQEIMVNRLDSNRQEGFVPSDSNLTVPFEKGGYLYEVHARFKQGWVLYYFYISVV